MTLRLAFLIGVLVFLPATWLRDLWAPDEPRHAEVARTMVVSGDPLLPHLAGEVYPDKPAPPFWLMAASMRLFGVHDWAARIPFVAAAAGCLALLAYLGRLLGLSGAVTALGVLLLASSYRFLWLGQRVSLDMLLTFFTTLSITGWVRQWRALGSGFVNGLVFFGAAALAVSVKGPIGLLVPLFCAVSHAFSTRRMGRLLTPSFLAGAVVLPLLVAAWLVPSCLAGGGAYTRELLFHQSAGRVFQAWNHEHGFLYYFLKLPLEFLPWTPLLVLALVLAVRRRMEGDSGVVRLLISWFLPTFLFLSMVQSKRGNYLLPVYPALALLSALAVASGAHLVPILRRIAVGIAILFLLAAVGLLVAPFLPVLATVGLHGLLPGAWAVAVLLAGGALLCWRAPAFRAPPASFGVLAVAVLAVVPVAGLLVMPVIDEVKSPRQLAETLVRAAGDGPRLVPFYGVRPAEYRFYTGLDCRKMDKEEFVRRLRRPEVELAVLTVHRWRKVKDLLPEGSVEIARRKVGGKDEVLILRIPRKTREGQEDSR